MRLRTRIIFFTVAWLIVLMPFLFWRETWFGTPLSDDKISQYLRDDGKPRHIQHALVQVGERIQKRDAGVERWYPELVRLAKHPVEEVRNTDAWVMGQDPSRPEFREALRGMLQDASPPVRSNAALSLVSFGDDAGHDQIVNMLEPVTVTAPQAGRIEAIAPGGEAIRRGTLLARLRTAEGIEELRAPIGGRIAQVQAQAGAELQAGAAVATITPGAEQVWEALRALYLVGRVQDLEAVRRYKQPREELPERIQQQAELTEQAILRRAQGEAR